MADPSSGPQPPDPSTGKRCKARKSNGQPCGSWAMIGQEVCRTHGGSSPQAKAAAERRLAEQAAATAAVTLGLPVEIEPHRALLDEVHRAAGVVAWLSLQVRELKAAEVVWGKVEEVEREVGPASQAAAHEVKHQAGVNVWVKLLGEWSDRLAKTAKMAIDAGVSERLVRLEERKGEMIARLLAEIIDDESVGLDDGQRQRMRVVAADRLRALPAA